MCVKETKVQKQLKEQLWSLQHRKVTIQVRTLTGQTITVSCPVLNTVRHLKHEIESGLGIPPWQQLLFLLPNASNTLTDDNHSQNETDGNGCEEHADCSPLIDHFHLCECFVEQLVWRGSFDKEGTGKTGSDCVEVLLIHDKSLYDGDVANNADGDDVVDNADGQEFHDQEEIQAEITPPSGICSACYMYR